MSLHRCGHVFNKECLTMWLRGHDSYPFCRGSFPSEVQTILIFTKFNFSNTFYSFMPHPYLILHVCSS